MKEKHAVGSRWVGLSFVPFFLALIHPGVAGELPNVIFILADDIGQTQLGCYGGPYSTPHLDAIAAEGMQFNQAYASAAVCSPTRAAIMTGKYPARLHLTDFIKGNEDTDYPLAQPDWQKFLPLDETTLGEAFKALGYQTAHFGKWHLSIEKEPPGSEPYNPDKQGFDEYWITYKPKANQTDPEGDPHNVDLITDRAVRFLKENREGPFFLFVSHNSIHDPVMEAAEKVKQFESEKSKFFERHQEWKVWPVIAAMVERLDEGTGRLLDAVEELGLGENTIVVFTGDNGGRERYAQQRPFRAGKGWLYEGGIREPLLVRWPGVIPAGSESDLIVSSIDFFPTLLEGVGASWDKPIDGTSFWKELTGEADLPDRAQFWHYPHYHRGSRMRPASAMRSGRYKLIEWHEPLLLGEEGAYELFDLETDAGERTNLAGERPELLKELKAELANWKEDVGAQMPVRNPDF